MNKVEGGNKIRIFLVEKIYPEQEESFFVKVMREEVDKKIMPKENLLANSVVITNNLENADIILVPQAINNSSKQILIYLDRVRSMSKLRGIPAIIFIYGDLSHHLHFKDFIILRHTMYKTLMNVNDIIVPPFCEDLGEKFAISVRHKDHNLPVVSFCGWAGFSNSWLFIKYILRSLLNLSSVVIYGSGYIKYKKGLYFRRKCIKVVRGSGLIDSSIIVRNSFLGKLKDISNSLEMRREYFDNMYNSDFVLTPKGDANYSVRFFEVLSLGRIPILIDTDTVLPLEDKIKYSDFIIRVPYYRIKDIPKIVSEFYDKLSDSEYVNMQKLARGAFEKYLRYDVFLTRVFRDVVNMHENNNI